MSKSCKVHGLYEKFMKRLLDCFLASLSLVLFFPILMFIAVLVKLELGSPVLFKQPRPGKDEKIFYLYKFRSMSNAKDATGKLLSDDERLTKFGRILRSTSLDELPELFNIIRGDMALVGPRPLLVEYLPYYSKNEHQRHRVRPGLTGLAQINGRNATTWEEKFDWDLKYVNKITFWGDLKILIATIGKVFKQSNVLVGKQIPSGRLDTAREKQEVDYSDES